MLFQEIYNVYFTTVTAILQEAVRGQLTQDRLYQLVREKAFEESVLTLPQALQQEWPLLRKDLSTVIRHPPQQPLSLLEKRWLATLLQDPRIQLFSPSTQGLEKLKPLFDWQDIVYYDRYQDGDNFRSPHYIANFRTILQAIQQRQELAFTYYTKGHRLQKLHFLPLYLEYSAKDDKFRVRGSGAQRSYILRLSGIHSCTLLADPPPLGGVLEPPQQQLAFILDDHRNALNRALLQFSHFAKETTRLTAHTYQITISYDSEDEAELIIRLLSLGPLIQVLSPDRIIQKLKARLLRQLAFYDKQL